MFRNIIRALGPCMAMGCSAVASAHHGAPYEIAATEQTAASPMGAALAMIVIALAVRVVIRRSRK